MFSFESDALAGTNKVFNPFQAKILLYFSGSWYSAVTIPESNELKENYDLEYVKNDRKDT